nr:hypothetical protein [Tanacetum cinerariifolium]
TIDTTIEQQAIMDEALVPHAQRDMLHICPRIHRQSFDEPPFKEEILAFIHFLRHNAAIRTLTDVNINKLYQPWRSFAAIINKCLTGKSSGYDSLRLSKASILDEHMFSTIKLTYISHASGSGADEGTGSIPRVSDVPTDESEEEFSWNSTDDEGDADDGKDGDDDEEDEGDDGEEGDGDDDDEDDDGDQEYDDEYAEETRDEESFDPITQTPENNDDEGNGEEDIGLNIGGEEGHDKKEEEDELYRDVNINQGRGIQANLEGKDSYVILTPTPTSVAPLPMTTPTMTPSTIATITITSQAPILPTTVLSSIIQNLPNFGSLFRFDDRLRSLEENFFEFTQTNQFAGAVFAIPGIVQRYMDQRMNKEVKMAVQVQSDRLRNEAQRENEEFLKTVDENMQKIIKENLYKALVEAYESNKIILDTYEETVTLKRRRDDDADKDEEPSAGPDQGSKRHREGKEPESASAPTKTATRSAGRSTVSTQSRVSSLIPNNQGRHVIPFEHFINNNLEYLRGGASSRKYTTSITKTKATDYGHIKWIEDLVPRTMWIEEPIGYDKHSLWGRRIIDVTELKIVECHSYKHLDWITVRRDDDKIYKFKEGDFKRLRIQDIEDMLLLLVQDLQLGVKSYQKKLNLTKLDSYRSDLKRKEAYTAYSNPQGFIYQNKDKKSRLMQIDELHKFSDETLIDVRTALDDRLKGIRMQYLPKSIRRKSEKDRAAAMIQAIDKGLKIKRIMRSLERFVRGRLYEGDFMMLQRTIC